MNPPNWVSFREQIPPLDTRLLIWQPGAGWAAVAEVSAVPEWDREEDSPTFRVYLCGVSDTNDYSHWMPLPDGPGVGQKGENP